jgi:hypothetical protein
MKVALAWFALLAVIWTGGCERSTPRGVTREVLCDLEGVTIISGGIYPWQVSISPSGAHIAVRRAIRIDLNKYRHRMEIDGVPGPEFQDVHWWPQTQGDVTCWSQDGRAAAYTAEEYQGKTKLYYFVYGTNKFGPYSGANFVLSPNGARWGAIVSPLGADPDPAKSPPSILIDGKEAQLPFKIAWDQLNFPTLNPASPDLGCLRFDENENTFIVQAAARQWRTMDGRPARRPPAPDPQWRWPDAPKGLVVRTPETTNTFRFGRDNYPRRCHELWLGNRRLGEFDFILGGAAHSAYRQPGGTVFFYVVRNGKLIRLRVSPPQRSVPAAGQKTNLSVVSR